MPITRNYGNPCKTNGSHHTQFLTNHTKSTLCAPVSARFKVAMNWPPGSSVSRCVPVDRQSRPPSTLRYLTHQRADLVRGGGNISTAPECRTTSGARPNHPMGNYGFRTRSCGQGQGNLGISGCLTAARPNLATGGRVARGVLTGGVEPTSPRFQHGATTELASPSTSRTAPRQGIEPYVYRLKAGGFAIEACEASLTVRGAGIEPTPSTFTGWLQCQH